MKILSNKIQCNKCKDIIESTHIHDCKWCKCGTVAVDGGHSYLKRCTKDMDAIVELSDFEEEQHKMVCSICKQIHNYELEECEVCGKLMCESCSPNGYCCDICYGM